MNTLFFAVFYVNYTVLNSNVISEIHNSLHTILHIQAFRKELLPCTEVEEVYHRDTDISEGGQCRTSRGSCRDS